MAVFLKRLDSQDSYEIRQGNRGKSILLGTVDYRKTRAIELNNHFPIYWNDSINPEKSHSIGSFDSLESASQILLAYARAHAQTFSNKDELFFDLTINSGRSRKKPKFKKLKSLDDYPDQPGGRPGGAATLHFH